MNPLAITPAFTGKVAIPQSALLERDEILSTSKQIEGVESQEELEAAVSALRNLTELEKITEAGRKKEKRPFLDFNALIDQFASTFIAPVTMEKNRITAFIDSWQRKQLAIQREAERKAAEEKRKAEQQAQEAQRKAEEAQREIDRLNSLPVTTRDGLLIRDGKTIQLPEADKVARRAGYKHAEEMVRALEKQMRDAESQKLKQQLANEEAIIAQKQSAIVAPSNTPVGLATRVAFDFEVIDPRKFISKKPDLFVWKAGEEAFHLNRSGLKKALNSDIPNDYTGWLPPEGTESVVMSDYGIRIYVSVKTNVRS